MALITPPTSSSSDTNLGKHASSGGSDVCTPEERRQKKLLSKREWARRSRLKKTQQREDLEAEISRLTDENNRLTDKVNVVTQKVIGLESDNDVQRAKKMLLMERLSYAISMQEFFGGVRHSR
ncbi:hypothetical protein ACFE04_016653 [Oxalis oulophora]